MVKLSLIKTEQKNRRTEHIDRLSTGEMLSLINEEDKMVAYAVEKELIFIEKAVDIIYEALSVGGRLIYCGCGTSGRLGILDAVECPPTFGTDPELVQGIIAGGSGAIVKAVEGAEDNYNLGEEDLKAINFSDKDVLVGIAASGRTPYVIGAVQYAKRIGARTVSLTCCPGSELHKLTDVSIAPITGPEVITGSTRMKCGSAQKMVLNMLSTSVMIKLGKVYGNLMVDVKATNEKLIERTVTIVKSSTGVSDARAREALSQCDYSAKTAIVMVQCNCSREEAEELLVKAKGRISDILNACRAE
jgi:N-acetylmuramic acid 6-phosphate etherase